MQDSTKGGVIVLVLILALVGYFVLWTPGCSTGPVPAENNGDNGGSSTAPSKAKVGQLAPDFERTTLSGDAIKLSDFIGEKAVILDFWATWCGPCKTELPILEEFYKANSDQVEIIAITNEPAGDRAKIERIISEKGVTFVVVHDSSGEIAKKYPSQYIPYLVFIDKEGKVVETHTGADENIGLKIKEAFGLE